MVEPIFDEIVRWLNEPRNRDEFITLYLDLSTNLKRWKQEQALIDQIESSFSSLIIHSNTTLTLRQNIQANRRVMIVTRNPLSVATTLFFNTNTPASCFWQERDIKQICFSNGTVRAESEKLAGKTDHTHLFYSRIVTNQLRYGPLSKDFIPFPSPVNFSPINVFDLYGIGVNSLATDYISNDQIQQHFWLWEDTLSIEQLAKKYAHLCVLMKSNGKWNVAPCNESRAVLCRSEDNHEHYAIGARISNPHLFIPSLHEEEKVRDEAQFICPDGFSFNPPVSLYSNC